MSNLTNVFSILMFTILFIILAYSCIPDNKGKERNESIENIIQTEPLSFAQFNNIKDVNKCEYEFIVVGEVLIKKSLDFDQVSGIPCGCDYDLTIPFYLHAQKVKVIGRYNDNEDILRAVKAPEGWEIMQWNYSMVWFVSKKNCLEEIEDTPKDSIK